MSKKGSATVFVDLPKEGAELAFSEKEVKIKAFPGSGSKVVPVTTDSQVAFAKKSKKKTIKQQFDNISDEDENENSLKSKPKLENKSTWWSFLTGLFDRRRDVQVYSLVDSDAVEEAEKNISDEGEGVELEVDQAGSLIELPKTGKVIKSGEDNYELALAVSRLSKNYVDQDYKVISDEQAATSSALSTLVLRFRSAKIATSDPEVRVEYAPKAVLKKSTVAVAIEVNETKFVEDLKSFFATAGNIEKLIRAKGEKGKEKEVLEAYVAAGGEHDKLDVFKLFSDSEKILDVKRILDLIVQSEVSKGPKLKFLNKKLEEIKDGTDSISIKGISDEYEKQIADKAKEIASPRALVEGDSSSEEEDSKVRIKKKKAAPRVKIATAAAFGQTQAASLVSNQFTNALTKEAVAKVAAKILAAADDKVALDKPLVDALASKSVIDNLASNEDTAEEELDDEAGSVVSDDDDDDEREEGRSVIEKSSQNDIDDQSVSDGDGSSENDDNDSTIDGVDEVDDEFSKTESESLSDAESEFGDLERRDSFESVASPEKERGKLNLDSLKRDAAIKVFFEKNKVAGDSSGTVTIVGVEGVSFVIKKAEGEGDKFSVFAIGEAEVELTAVEDLDKAVNSLGRKLIFNAAAAGEVDYLQACLDVGVSLSEKDDVGATPLHWAADKSKKGACEFLVNNGADIFAMDDDGWTALVWGNGEAKDFLNEKREEVCRHYYDEFSPSAEKKNEVLGAFYAQLPGDLTSTQRQFSDRDGFEYLIKKDGGNYSIVSFDDSTTEVVDTAEWKIGYALNDLGRKSIFNAAAAGDVPYLQACLDVGVSLSERDTANGGTPLHWAAYNSKKDACKFLVNNGADIFRMDAQGKTALFLARQNGDEEIIAILLAESAKKPNLPNLKLARQNAVLKNFFGDDEALIEKEINGSEGQYLIRKDGENYSVSVLVKNTAKRLGSFVQKLEKKELSAAIGDLGRSLIFDAARSKNTELFKACLEAGASVDAADENGNKPLFYAQQDPKNEEIANLISERKKDPTTEKAKESRNKFRELAALVRDAHLAGGDVQEVITQFGIDNTDFKIAGLNAGDMTVFMQDISLKKDKVPNLDIKPVTQDLYSGGTKDFYVQSLLNGRNIKGVNEPGGEEIKAFYQRLLITCLEDKHRFISDEDNDNIRKLIVERAKDKAATHDIGYSALNSVDKDSVAGLYMRARFEELKEREGLNENLTYEDFSRNLGDVVKINSKLDEERFEGDIKLREKELKALKSSVDEKDEAKIKLKEEYLKVLRDRKNDEKYKDSLDQNIRALNALLGSGDEKAANKNLDRRAHRDLKLTLNMMRGEVEFTPANILENGERKEQEAAIKLQSSSRGLNSRRRMADVREVKKVESEVIKIRGWDLTESLANFEMSDDFVIKNEKFKSDYGKHEIKEVKGEKIYNGNTGLVIHEFSGLDGLSVFTDQVEEANKREGIGPNFTSEVSIAHIKDLPTDSGRVKNSFCIAVLNDAGATKIFSKKFDEITNRSSDLYKENIKFETDRAGIEAAIAVLTEARNNFMLGKIIESTTGDKVIPGPGLIIQNNALRQFYSNQLAGLRECLRGSEPNSGDSPEQKEIKRQDFQSRLKKFNESTEGKDFIKLLKKEPEKHDMLSKENIQVIKNLLEGQSTEEMRDRARKHTSRQMQSEIAGRVKSSMRDNEHKFNLDALEVAEAVAKYQHQSLTQFINIADTRLGNGRGKKGFEELLNEKMPSSAYEGISVFRPRGQDNIATVTFNGAYTGDDTMYLALPDSPQCYIRVSRCDKDGPVSVWRDGKKVREDHKKGDVLIDTGVVFHRGDDGKYERNPIHLDDLEGRFGKGVKEAALDFKVKAISVNEGQRLSSAMLYNGKGIALELKAKSSPFREVDSHKPEADPEVDKLRRNAEVIFELVNGGAKASDLEVLNIKIGANARLVIGKEDQDSRLVTETGGATVETLLLDSKDSKTSEGFKANLKEALQSVTEKERKELLDKLLKDDGSKRNELITLCSDDKLEDLASEVASYIGSIRKQRLEDINKKYAVIDASEKVNLVIPVVLDNDVPGPKFSSPEIQLLDGTELKQMKIFDASDKLNAETKAQIIEKADLKFVQKFFSAKEIGSKTAQEFLQDDNNYRDLCNKMKTRCEVAKVTVALQKVVEDGTHDSKPKYKSEGELSFETFQQNSEGPKNIKSVEGEKASSKSFLLNKLPGRPTFLSNPKNTGRGF